MTAVEPTGVGVLIIHWNQPDLVARAVRSALSSSGVDPLVVVIDNGSEDHKFLRLLKLLQPTGAVVVAGSHVLDAPRGEADPDVRVHILRAGKNLGCTGARNRGMSYLFSDEAYEFAFLLDSDATLTPECLRRLVATWRPGVGLVGALILAGEDTSGETISFARSQVNWYGWPKSRDRGRSRSRVPRGGQSRTELVGGAAMLIPKVLWERVGGNDERYFFDVDDAEYSMRARQAGHQNLMVWDAVCWHEMGSSVRGRVPLSRYYNLRNVLLFSHDYNHGRRRLLFAAAFGLRLIRDAGKCLLHLDRRRAWAVFAAIRDYRRAQFGPGPPFLYT